MSSDAFLVEHTPGPTIDLPDDVRAAREALARATANYLSVEDGTLDRPWPWRDDPNGEAEIRYAFYRALEALESAEVEARGMVDRSAIQRSRAARIAAPATAARWALHGALAPLADDELDRDPGGGEWTLRQTLAHVINSQRAYGWYTAWWLARRNEPDFPAFAPDIDGFPDESAEGNGSLGEVRARLDAILDLAAGRLGGLDEAGLAARARWSGYPVDVAFRMGRWSSHIQEHTVQVDKTLAMLGRQPREVERLVRLLHAGYGRLEAVVFAVPPIDLERAGVAGLVEQAAAEVERLGDEIARTARAA